MTLQFNPAYLDTRVLAQLRETFTEKKHLLLNQFAKLPTPTKWKHAYIPDAHSYDSAAFTPPDALTQFIETIVQQKLQLLDSTFLRFGSSDYTILRDGPAKDVIEVILCLSEWNTEWGGNIIYKTDYEATVIRPQLNALSIVQTGKKKCFVQYVNHHAGKNKLVLAVLTFHKNKR